ncbi:hypothetical protein FQN51_005790 [Onygenales sp. PD_10]|nr:hypothetical protein FQN51_005790 [Onygenales sp. PD_10]
MMYIPDKPHDAPAVAWAMGPSTYEHRACPIPDPASLKKRKRDMDGWDAQNNGNVGICTTGLIPSNAQYIDEKFRDTHPHYLKELPAGAMPSKFTPWSCPERGTLHFRPCLQPIPMKRRRLIQQQYQHHHQSQQSQEWNALPVNLSTGQKQQQQQQQHFYSDFGNTISKPSLLSPKSKFNTHINHPTPPPSQSDHQPHNNKQSTSSRPALSPCHICHRRPTTRSILDAYADCNLCGERTCYICLRECMAADCEGPRSPSDPDSRHGRNASEGNSSDWQGGRTRHGSGHWDGDTGSGGGAGAGRKVCSLCAVEGVMEGGGEVVRCLACVAAW